MNARNDKMSPEELKQYLNKIMTSSDASSSKVSDVTGTSIRQIRVYNIEVMLHSSDTALVLVNKLQAKVVITPPHQRQQQRS